MRVAYVCADPGVPVFGMKGSSIHVQEVLRALLQTGAEVELFATRTGGSAPQDLSRVAVHALPGAPKGEPADREQAQLAANDAIVAALQDQGPFDLVYERYSLWSHAGMTYARSAGIPGVLEVNAPLVAEQAQHRGLIDRAAAEDVARRAFGAASLLVAVSREVGAYLQAIPEAAGRVQVIPNGVNPGRFPEDLTPDLPAPGVFTVGFVGTLKPWHGLPTLLEAFEELRREVPASRLLIVGDGPERETLATQLQERGLDGDVIFTGAVASECIPGLLASMDVAAAPYGNLEEFYFSPLKVYEYMAAGLPVVAGDIGQLQDLIKHGHSGLLYSPGDAAALTAALRTLHEDAALRRRLGETARQAVLAHHTWDGRVREILSLAGASPARRSA